MHFPLRPGTEVFIGFVEGDPDRPLIVGAIPNPETPSPVEAPNQTQNVLRSGGHNELVMEDLSGRERIRVHTPHSNTTLQLGSLDEAETGALLRTDAHITMSAAQSIDTVAFRRTSVSQRATTLVGENAVLLVGIESLKSSAEAAYRNFESLGVRSAPIQNDIRDLGTAPWPHTNAKHGSALGALCWAHLWRRAIAFDCGLRDERAEEELRPGIFRAPARTTDRDGVPQKEQAVEMTVYRDGLVIAEGEHVRVFRYRRAGSVGDRRDGASRLWICPYPAGEACRWVTHRLLPPTPYDADPPIAPLVLAHGAQQCSIPELLGDRVLVRDVPLLQFPLPIPSWRPAEPLPPLEVGKEPEP